MPDRYYAGGGPYAAEAGSLYQLLVDSVADYAIFALDPGGHIVTWNPGAQRFKGYKADEIIGQHFSVFYPEADRLARKPEIELAIAAAEGRVEDEGWRIRKDGTRFWANVVITALRDDSRTLVGFAKVTRDLTERREAQLKAIEDAKRLAEAEAANKAKAEFLAAMSHELRTPLNAIGGYTELLAMGLRGPVTEQQQADLERITASQRHLLGIVNDLLNFSRIEAGKLVYDVGPVDLLKVIDEVMLMVQPLAQQKNLELRREPCPEGVIAAADQMKVEQIMINLTSNAVSYTDTGGWVSVGCGLTKDRVWLTVRDSGIGIPPEKLESIFEPFVQLGRSLTTSHRGTGLGLAISRDLARGMGGELSAESHVGHGSVFTLALPRHEQESAKA